MALLKYLQKKDGPLPNPNGTLSIHISPRTIEDCNKRVSKILKVVESPKAETPKRGKYAVYSPNYRATIGKYASENRPASTIRKFKTDFPNLKESTVRSFRDSYKKEIKSRKRKLDFDSDVANVDEIQVKKRGRKTLLGEDLDKQVQMYIQTLRNSGGVVNSSICLAVGHVIICASDKQLLSEFGGPITLTKSWEASLLKRMSYVKRRGSCTAKVQISDTKFEELKTDYLNCIQIAVDKHDIPPELIYNWYHTGINYVPVSNWTMEVEGSKKVPIVGLDDKWQITVVFGGTLSGEFLPPQMIYQGLTEACHAQYDFPLSWNITHCPNHWANQETQSDYTRKILLPHIKKTKKSLCLPDKQKSLCIFDVFRAQMGEDFIQELKDNNIEIVYVPASCTDRLQPMDLLVQKVVKNKMKQHFQKWYSTCICKQLDKGMKIDELTPVDLRLSIMKPLAAEWLFQTYTDIRANKELIFKGFEKAGIAEIVDFQFE